MTQARAMFGRDLNLPGNSIKVPKNDWKNLKFQERLKYVLAKTQEHIISQMELKRTRKVKYGLIEITTFQPGDLVAL